MATQKVRVVLEPLLDVSKAVRVILMSESGRPYPVMYTLEAGEMKKSILPVFLSYLSGLSFSDESWVLVPDGFCPVGLQVLMKVADKTSTNVEEPSEAHHPIGKVHCIDIEHPCNDYFRMISEVLEDLSTDSRWRASMACGKNQDMVSYRQKLANYMAKVASETPISVLMERPLDISMGRKYVSQNHVVHFGHHLPHMGMSLCLTTEDKHIWLGSEATRKEVVGRNYSSFYDSPLHLAIIQSEEEELIAKEIFWGSRGMNRYVISDVTPDSASPHEGIRLSTPGMGDNISKRFLKANAWKTGLSELSEEAHRWIKEVAGMGVMGMSASAGYGSPSVVAKVTCALAFASTATAFWLPRKWITTTRVLTKVGAIFCIAGVLAAIGNDLPLEYKWWVAVLAFLGPAAAVVLS